MKIIILGAGRVGGTLAEHLARHHDITVIDSDGEQLMRLQERLDINTIIGHASYPEVLKEAHASQADMLIAVTSSDETNMLACQIAYSIFQTPTKIARVRAPEYLNLQDIFKDHDIPINVLISPELLVTQLMVELVRYPGSLQVLDFANRRLQLVGVKAKPGGLLIGHQIKEIKDHIPNVEIRVAAIYRGSQVIVPDGSTVIEVNDEVYFVATPQNIQEAISEMQKLEKPYRRILIAGGGHIGFQLAKKLESTINVKIIEQDKTRAQLLSEWLNNAVVLVGDACDRNLLVNEHIEDIDVFAAMTNSDETNIMACILAKRLGVRKVMCLINRGDYLDIIENTDIDIAISPRQATISSLLQHIRRGDIVEAHSLKRGGAEAIEAIAHGDYESSHIVGRSIEELPLPQEATIVAVIRSNQVIIAHHDTVIETDDHVILFLSDPEKMPSIERLFKVNFNYF